MEKEQEQNQVMSKSRKWVECANRLIDYGSWIFIAVLVYMWYVSKGQTKVLQCSDINIDMCNACFNGFKQIVKIP